MWREINLNISPAFILFFSPNSNLYRAQKHNQIPETKTLEEGSARRNITRKHDPTPNKKDKKQGGGGGGKGKWNTVDDGSLL